MDIRSEYKAFRIRAGAAIDSMNHRNNGERGVDEWIKANGIDAAISQFDDGNFGLAYAELKEKLAYKIVSDSRGASEDDVEAWIKQNGVDDAIDLVEN